MFYYSYVKFILSWTQNRLWILGNTWKVHNIFVVVYILKWKFTRAIKFLASDTGDLHNSLCDIFFVVNKFNVVVKHAASRIYPSVSKVRLAKKIIKRGRGFPVSQQSCWKIEILQKKTLKIVLSRSTMTLREILLRSHLHNFKYLQTSQLVCFLLKKSQSSCEIIFDITLNLFVMSNICYSHMNSALLRRDKILL